VCPVNGAFTTGKCHSRVEKWCFRSLYVKPRSGTSLLDVNYFRVIFEPSGGPFLKAITCIFASNKQGGWKQAENLCEGLRRAGWDAGLGARDEGGGRVAGGRAREIFKCAGERDQGGVSLARGRGYLCSA
jgi:hypothetical protein